MNQIQTKEQEIAELEKELQQLNQRIEQKQNQTSQTDTDVEEIKLEAPSSINSDTQKHEGLPELPKNIYTKEELKKEFQKPDKLELLYQVLEKEEDQISDGIAMLIMALKQCRKEGLTPDKIVEQFQELE